MRKSYSRTLTISVALLAKFFLPVFKYLIYLVGQFHQLFVVGFGRGALT